jgi:hypothetical protein
MYDLLKVSDGLIGHGDGFVNVNGICALASMAGDSSFAEPQFSRIPSSCLPAVQRRDHHRKDLQLYRAGHQRYVSFAFSRHLRRLEGTQRHPGPPGG